MDRTLTKTRLAQTESHVMRGEWVIARQRAITAMLESDGHHDVAASARAILRAFEALQAQHIADLDRLRRELAGVSV